MKSTMIKEAHIQAGAKMVEFAGFYMPIKYTGVTEEHQYVRQHVGLFDVSHMGEFFIEGPQSLDLVQYITSNDASKLKPGQAQYSCFPNHEGGIVDDLIVYRLDDKEGMSRYMLVVNGANIEKDLAWIVSNNSFDASCTNRSDEISLFALQGPKAKALLQTLTAKPLDGIKFYHFDAGQVGGIDNVLISATGYTGSGGFELYVKNEDAIQLWKVLAEKLAHFEGGLCGLGARDTLRLEMGYCLYGNEITEQTSPIEAGLGWITKTGKGKFIGLEKILEIKAKPKRKLISFTVEGRRIPRTGYVIENEEGMEIGTVSSGTMSPSLGIPIGMGYVPIELSHLGQVIFVRAGKKSLRAIVRKSPLVKV